MPLEFSLKASSGIMSLFTQGCFMQGSRIRRDTKDVAGQKFGDLTALYAIGKGKYRGVIWRCKCICGNECDAFGGHLRDGTRKSCGCRSQRRIEETGINRLFSLYKRKGTIRDIEFTLDRDFFEKLIIGNCHYCGIEPENKLMKLKKTEQVQIKYNGIDRVDPNKGYTADNCVSSCYFCNLSKTNLSVDQWREHLKRLCNYQGISNGNR